MMHGELTNATIALLITDNLVLCYTQVIKRHNSLVWDNYRVSVFYYPHHVYT